MWNQKFETKNNVDKCMKHVSFLRVVQVKTESLQVSLLLLAEEQVSFPSSLYLLYKMARRKFLSLSENEEFVNDPNLQSKLLESNDEETCTDIVELPPESVDVVSDKEEIDEDNLGEQHSGGASHLKCKRVRH